MAGTRECEEETVEGVETGEETGEYVEEGERYEGVAAVDWTAVAGGDAPCLYYDCDDEDDEGWGSEGSG